MGPMGRAVPYPARGPGPTEGAPLPQSRMDQRTRERLPATDPADDRGQDIGEFVADDQRPLGVSLRRRDLKQRDGLAGTGQRALEEAVMTELGELLDADPGVPQRLDRGPGPEPPVFLAGHVPAFARVGVLSPDPRRAVTTGFGSPHPPVGDGERRARRVARVAASPATTAPCRCS